MWKPPFRLDIIGGLQLGNNHLEVEVTNNWANRLIGDEQLPDDCEWIPVPGRGWHLKEWPQWLVENKPRQDFPHNFSALLDECQFQLCVRR